MKILLFTDLHLGMKTENKGGKNGINTHGDLINLSLLRSEIDKVEPDIVINLGDTVQAEDKDRYMALYDDFLNTFSDLKMYNVYGNHDLVRLSMEELNELTDQTDKISFDLEGIKHIIANCKRENGAISMDEATIQWISDEIDVSEKAMIYFHYPISDDEGNLAYYHKEKPENAFIKESKQLRDLFVKSGKVIAVISGHTHFLFDKTIDGIRHITVPSFSEDKDGKPCQEYMILEVPSMDLEIKKLE